MTDSKNPVGRPSWPYDSEIGEEICEIIGSSDLGLEQVLDEMRLLRGPEKVPSIRTCYRWLEHSEGFRQAYARARTHQAQILHDRAQQQAQTPLIGKIIDRIETDKGTEIREKTVDNVERSKLIVYTTLKRAGQLDAKKYGEKHQLTNPDGDGPPVLKIEVKSVLDEPEGK